MKRIIENIKAQGFVEDLSWERKRRITEEEVTQAKFAKMDIDNLLGTIGDCEAKWAVTADKSGEAQEHLIALYNKAIEYYSGTENLEQSMVYLGKLKQLFAEQEAAAQQTPQPQRVEGGAPAEGEPRAGADQPAADTTSQINAEESKE